MPLGPIVGADPAEWKRMLDVNVTALMTIERRFADTERLQAVDIAEAIVFMVTRPRRAAVSEMLFRPTEQER